MKKTRSAKKVQVHSNKRFFWLLLVPIIAIIFSVQVVRAKDSKSSNDALTSGTCSQRKVSQIKSELLSLVSNLVLHPKKDIDKNLKPALKRFKKQENQKDKNYVIPQKSLYKDSAVTKQAQVDSQVKSLVKSVDNLNCDNLDSQKEDIRLKMADLLTNSLPSYKQAKTAFVLIMNTNKVPQSTAAPTQIPTAFPSPTPSS